MSTRTPLSLRLRVLGLVLGCEVLLLLAAGLILLHDQSHILTSAFDSSLQSNAESLATLVEYDTETKEANLEFSDEVMTRFSKKTRPDLFTIFGPDKKVIESSRSMAEKLDWVMPSEKRIARNFVYHGTSYRGILLPTKMEAGEDDHEERLPITVFFAASRYQLDDRLEDSATHTALVALAFLISSAAGVWWAAGRGLASVGRFAKKARSISEQNLDERFVPQSFPTELQPLARDFNELLARLQGAFERERRFSADAAHELKTPVASLKAGIQSAQLNRSEDASSLEVLDDLFAETERLEALCEALLDLAHGESSRAVRPEVGLLELQKEVGTIARDISQKEHRDITVLTTGDQTLERAGTSLSTARRILNNLIHNAVHHAGPRAHVTVSMAAEPRQIFVSVEDNGAGIPPDAQGRLFERFFRADGHRARTSGGAGLGLAICRALARSEGGEVAFEPVEPSGCRFIWRIPVPNAPSTTP